MTDRYRLSKNCNLDGWYSLRDGASGQRIAMALDHELGQRIVALLNGEHLFADSAGRTWHIMEREGGSICLYYTRDNNPAHFVVWDSLDAGLDGGEATDG